MMSFITLGRASGGLSLILAGIVVFGSMPVAGSDGQVSAATLAGTAPAISERYFQRGFDPISENGLLTVIVEIPAGTLQKWEISKTSGQLNWETKYGIPRLIHYLSYPANYGMIPGTISRKELGGDGDALDVLVLGEAEPRGAVLQVRPVAVLRLVDHGEIDDKIITVKTQGPLSDVTSLKGLKKNYPGVTKIIETWFLNYKGKGYTKSQGLQGKSKTVKLIEAAKY